MTQLRKLKLSSKILLQLTFLFRKWVAKNIKREKRKRGEKEKKKKKDERGA